MAAAALLAQQPPQVAPHMHPTFWMQRSLGERSVICHGGKTGGIFPPAFGVQIQFNRNPAGDVQSLTLHQGGHTLTGQRE